MSMVSQIVVFDSEHVWGMGETEELAKIDARTWYKESGSDFDADLQSGVLRIAPASDYLVKLVNEKGGEAVNPVVQAGVATIRS